MYCILLILSKIILISAIWPPPYKVDLKQSEEFIIGDYFKSDDLFDPDDEMIEDEEIKTFNLDKDKHKFHLLHKQVKRYNDKADENKYYLKNNTNVIKEDNETYYNEYDEEFIPFQAGFVDKNNQFILNQENENVYYLNKISKQLESSYIKPKREEKKNNDYDYQELNKEYSIEIEKEIKLNEAFNLTSIQDNNESVKEAVDLMVDFKSTPKNCTEEEMKGIGFQAIKCAWIDLKKARTGKRRLILLMRIKKIFFIWFLIYLAVAVPLWCHKGWGCCCFRCKMCKPRQVLDEAKKYYVESPPGVYLANNGYTITYEPNIYEIDAYKKLERALMTL